MRNVNQGWKTNDDKDLEEIINFLLNSSGNNSQSIGRALKILNNKINQKAEPIRRYGIEDKI
jgi:deoxyhypusine synthase